MAEGESVNHDILRRLPSIEELMNTEAVSRLVREHDRALVVDAARAVVDALRGEIIDGAPDAEESISAPAIGARVVEYVQAKLRPSLRGAINAAGIILHTGLGRAMLSPAAVEQIDDVVRGYCNLAIDSDTGQRASRDSHVASLLCELTGAEAATVVNNNAAATMIVLNTLARDREVIVSRGQLVEIGGSFRMPDVMQASGAILREVGTTNKTHLRDYVSAINENTGAILRVHQSNYRIVGFTEEPSIRDLAKVAKEHNVPLIDDLGSGALVDLAKYGLESEPLVRDSIQAGVDAACFSGDKLIGGPQSGIIVGKADQIARIKKNPLARALRVGKLEVAAMEATLRLFLEPDRLHETHPTYRMMSLTAAAIGERARAAALTLEGAAAEVDVVEGSSQVGSGSVPAEMLPTMLLRVKPTDISADALARNLRRHTPPIFARIQQDAVVFDFRTVQPGEESLVTGALLDLLGRKETC